MVEQLPVKELVPGSSPGRGAKTHTPQYRARMGWFELRVVGTLQVMNDFVIHACEQVLRFTQVERWDDLSEERKVQLGFNMGVVALGLHLSKEESFQALADARAGLVSMQAFREHLALLIAANKIEVNEAHVVRPF